MHVLLSPPHTLHSSNSKPLLGIPSQPAHKLLSPPHTPHSSKPKDPPHTPSQSTSTTQFPSQSKFSSGRLASQSHAKLHIPHATGHSEATQPFSQP